MDLLHYIQTQWQQLASGPEPTLPPAIPVVVGVSGGADSLALLHVLQQVLQPGGVIVAHLDHGLRPSSAADARLVAETAAAWGLPCEVTRVDVAGLARLHRQSLEEAGRHARYGFLAQVARAAGATVVAVGHHAGDQAETVLLHLIRGAGLAGLRGMQTVAPLPGDAALHLWRPLLGVTRSDTAAHCTRHQLPAVTDATNLDPVYRRNAVRHQLLPALEALNPGIGARLSQLAELVAADEALLTELSAAAWRRTLWQEDANQVRLSLDEWRRLPLSLRRRLLRRVVRRLAPDEQASFRPIEQARQAAESGVTGTRAWLPGAIELEVTHEALHFVRGRRRPRPPGPQLADALVPLPVPGSVWLANGWQLTAEPAVVDLATVRANPDPWQAWVDVGRADLLQVRSRRPGERFQPLGMEGQSASVKAVMANRKIPAVLRAAWPLVCLPDRPVWLVGHHLDRRARITAGTSQAVRLACRPTAGPLDEWS